MGEQGGFLLVPRRGDIHVGTRRKTERLAAAIDLEEVQGESPLGRQVGPEGEDGGGLVVRVCVDRPMGKDQIGGFGGQEFEECLGPLAVNLGGAVDLTGKEGLGAEDFARRFGCFSVNSSWMTWRHFSGW
jgi:hypothetical protein